MTLVFFQIKTASLVGKHLVDARKQDTAQKSAHVDSTVDVKETNRTGDSQFEAPDDHNSDESEGLLKADEDGLETRESDLT